MAEQIDHDKAVNSAIRMVANGDKRGVQHGFQMVQTIHLIGHTKVIQISFDKVGSFKILMACIAFCQLVNPSHFKHAIG